MNGGINQLVDTYKGNPQPLEAKVQKAQQNQPPGKIPPDLEEAMALQKIADLRNSAQGQQAMQAGGAQQSVVEKLRQILGGMQAQGQMQGQPVMAARGGSIDQLMSNLGRHYAGGGIIAFQSAGSVKDPDKEDKEDKKPLRYYPLSEQGADYVARKEAAREAKTKEDAESETRRQGLVSQIPTGGPEAPASTGPMPSELERRVGNTLAAMPGASASKAFSGSGIRALMGLLGIAGDREEKSPVAATPPANIRSQLNAADAAQFAEKPAPKLPAAPTANVPPTANVNAPAAPAKPAEEAMSPLEKAIRDSIMKTMAQDPEAVRKKAMEQNAQFMGLDALLKPAQDRAAAREAKIKEIQGSRQPLWIDALMSANKPTRGGIAGVLQNMAVGTISGKQNYDAEDLKFLDELNKLNSEIDKAKIEGRYKDVAAGKEAVKDLISEKKQSEASGTSLLNKQAQIEATKQTAKDALAGRNQTASIQAQNVALAREERTRQFNEEQLRKIRQNDVDRANKIEAAVSKRVGNIDLLLQNPKLKPEEEAALLAKRNTIVKQVQAEYPPIKPEGAKFLGFEPSKKS